MLGLGEGRLDAGAVRQAANISTAFERVDFESDGIITFAELANVLRELGSWTDQELHDLFEIADKNGDGFIRYKEFSQWLMREWEDGGEEFAAAINGLEAHVAPVVHTSPQSEHQVQARLFCIRHSKPEWWDRSKHPKGAVRDPGLSEKGHSLAEKLAVQLQGVVRSFDVLLCSPLARALQTAAPLLAGSAPVTIGRAICHAQICEYGSTPSDFVPSRIAAAQPQLFGNEAAHEVEFTGFDCHGSEGVQSRAEAVAAWLHEDSKRWPKDAVVGIVSHQTFLDCLLLVLHNGDASGWEYGFPKFRIPKATFVESAFRYEPAGTDDVRENDRAPAEAEAKVNRKASFGDSESDLGDTLLDEEEAAEQAKISKMKMRGKRRSVSAASVSKTEVDNFVKPVYPKTAEEEAELLKCIQENEKMQVLFAHLSASALQDIVNAFQLKEVQEGEDVIRQGEKGDYLYICLEGSLDIFVARPGPDGRIAPGDRGGKVVSVGKGALFGELALMYTAPRAATVTVVSPIAKLWALHQRAFKVLLQSAGEKQFQMYEGWLRQVELLKPFNHHELALIADVMGSDLFDNGEDIVTQGDAGDAFFIVEDGTCAAYISGDDGEKQVKTYEVGGYFGEIALLTDEPRKATVRATGTGCAVLSVSKEDFTNLLGPVKDQLDQDIAKYPKYSAFAT